MTAALLRRALVPVLVLFAVGCDSRFKGGGELRAQKVVLRREVDGLREIVARLERGEPLLPPDDVLVAISDTLLRDLIGAQLPFEVDVDRFHLTLREAEALFRGSPVIRLRGTLFPRERPELVAAVNVLGGLEGIEVEPSTATLRARIAVDHIGIERAAGIEQLLSAATLDEVARAVRLRLTDRLPRIQIPVRVQQSIELPAVTTGPVRIHGARMPIRVAVSQVVAGQGQLWISVRFQPGDLVKTAEAPEVDDASAEEAGVSLGEDDEPAGGKPAAEGKGN